MSIHSLPTELFSLIFGLAQTRPVIDINFYSHRDFVDNLLSFSLVHSTWTGAAQTLLMENIWIQPVGRIVADLPAGVESVPFKTMLVKSLTLCDRSSTWGSRAIVVKISTIQQWAHVTCLRLISVSTIAIEDLAVLPNLKDLYVERSNCTSSQQQVTFPRLSRLTLNRPRILTGIEEAEPIFSPSTFPRLTSLALFVGSTDPSLHFDTFFQNLLPQITSLALTWCHGDRISSAYYVAIKYSLRILPKLVHLSLNLPWRVLLEFLVDLPEALDLDNLHIYLHYTKPQVSVEDFSAWKQLLEAVVSISGGKGTNSIKAKRVYVYGKKMVWTCTGMKRKLRKLCWVKGRAPFANFDGKCMGTFQ